MQQNFILTDVMKTGFHVDMEEFINLHSLHDQSFTMTGEYYTLHNYDLDVFDRKIAFIDRTRLYKTHPSHNPEFRKELDKRLSLLHSQGFKMIYTSPWESKQNISEMELYPPFENNQMLWHGGVSWFWFYMYRKYRNKILNFTHNTKKFDFLYLNKQPRTHRQKLYHRMQSNKLLDSSLFTYWPEFKLSLEYELPWVTQYPPNGLDQEIYEKQFNDTKYNLVSETNDNNTDVFMTEKIWKPIIAQQVFIVHGNHLYLQKLRELGFKTFNSYFDESYDLESDPDERIELIVSLCETLLKKDWRDLYLQTIALRQHNYDNFFNLEKLQQQINKTLIGFFEFVDSGKISS